MALYPRRQHDHNATRRPAGQGLSAVAPRSSGQAGQREARRAERAGLRDGGVFGKEGVRGCLYEDCSRTRGTKAHLNAVFRRCSRPRALPGCPLWAAAATTEASLVSQRVTEMVDVVLKRRAWAVRTRERSIRARSHGSRFRAYARSRVRTRS